MAPRADPDVGYAFENARQEVLNWLRLLDSSKVLYCRYGINGTSVTVADLLLLVESDDAEGREIVRLYACGREFVPDAKLPKGVISEN